MPARGVPIVGVLEGGRRSAFIGICILFHNISFVTVYKAERKEITKGLSSAVKLSPTKRNIVVVLTVRILV